MFYKHSPENEKTLPNGVIRTIKSYINDLMVCELKWQKGMLGETHSHPHRQCGYIIKGKEAPLKCPACAHPRAYFEPKKENY